VSDFFFQIYIYIIIHLQELWGVCASVKFFLCCCSQLIFTLTLGKVTPCLLIGAPTASYGIHTNAGAVHIFDSVYFTYLGKMHADRALARFGRSFTQSEDYVFIGAPRYHEVFISTPF
jgi:hypothetical protein